MEFPEDEAEIIKLALRLAELMEQHPEDFPDPPASAAELRAQVEAFRAAQAESAAHDRELRQRQEEKDESLVVVKDVLKSNLHYAELNVRGKLEKLSGLGWGGSDPTGREPPGAVRDVAIRGQGDTWVVLEWRPPADGGPAAEYRVQRRKPGGRWEEVARAVDNDCLLSDQPRGLELDLRVLAVNPAGSGRPSEIVTVVL